MVRVHVVRDEELSALYYRVGDDQFPTGVYKQSERERLKYGPLPKTYSKDRS